MSSPERPYDPFIGALLRFPHQAIQRRIVREVNAAGFGEIHLAHFPVFSYPGPDGVRPSVLAERTAMTKQALNQLLRSLEGAGYLQREDGANGASGRVIRLTPRGHDLMAHIVRVVAEIETDWRRELGAERFEQLTALLRVVWASRLVE